MKFIKYYFFSKRKSLLCASKLIGQSIRFFTSKSSAISNEKACFCLIVLNSNVSWDFFLDSPTRLSVFFCLRKKSQRTTSILSLNFYCMGIVFSAEFFSISLIVLKKMFSYDLRIRLFFHWCRTSLQIFVLWPALLSDPKPYEKDSLLLFRRPPSIKSLFNSTLSFPVILTSLLFIFFHLVLNSL